MTATPHSKQVAAALQIVAAVGEVIQTLGAIPSGELYAQLMGHFSLERYEEIIGVLIQGGMVRRERSHLLVWIGPRRKAS